MDVQCPKCEHEFDAVEWHNGTCPMCGKFYDWDSQPIHDENGDITDEWTFIDWSL